MNFLIDPDLKRREFLQLKYYLESKDFEYVAKKLNIELFPTPNLDLEMVSIDYDRIPKNLRLGNLLEFFLEMILSYSKTYHVLAKNIQIIENKITIGELDFIIKNNEDNQILHIETATKFYLLEPSTRLWIGPNKKDSLKKKIIKMKEKQFPLLYKNATIKKLQSESIHSIHWTQKVHFKTFLFVSISENLRTFKGQEIAGLYYFFNEFKLLKNEKFSYFIPEKRDWLIDPLECQVWFKFESILESIKLHFIDNKNPLVWIKKSESLYEKAFVVNW